jgi:hypothetical protein
VRFEIAGHDILTPAFGRASASALRRPPDVDDTEPAEERVQLVLGEMSMWDDGAV